MSIRGVVFFGFFFAFTENYFLSTNFVHSGIKRAALVSFFMDQIQLRFAPMLSNRIMT